MLLEWAKVLVPLLVAVIPVIVAVVKTARDTRTNMSNELKAVSEKLDSHIEADEVSVQKQRRARILRFADEVSAGKVASEEMWADVMEDIDDYESYCDNHREYHNNKGVLSIEYIKNEYRKMKGM